MYFISSVLFGANTLFEKSLQGLQFPLHQSIYPWLYLSGFKLIRVGLEMHCWLFKDIHFLLSEILNTLTVVPLKLNNEISVFSY